MQILTNALFLWDRFSDKEAISMVITCIWDSIEDILAVLKDFGSMREEKKTDINSKTKCRKNGPII